MNQPPTVDPEFRDAVPGLAEEERRHLEDSLVREGCRDALVAWAETGILLDGHNRLKLCEQHGLSYRVETLSLPDRDAALDWIYSHQLGRRNLTPDLFKLILGRLYHRQKVKPEEHGNRVREALVGRPKGGDQNGHHPEKTRERLAKQHGVSPTTVQRAAEMASAYDAAREEQPGLTHEEALRVAKETVKPPATPKAPAKLTGDDRAERIRELAGQGHRAEQIAEELGHTAAFIRRIANSNDIAIYSQRGSRNVVDQERVVTETIAALEGIATGLSATKADPTGITKETAKEWLIALTEALRPINKLARQLKEIAE